MITEISPRQQVAVLYIMTGAAGTLLGAISQPPIGRAVDRIGYEPAFGASAIIMVLSMALLNGAGKIERIRPTTNDVAGSRASRKRSSDEGG